MTKITINGEELAIAFNLATELAYEKLTGKLFVAKEVIPADDNPGSDNIIKAAIACVIANNPDAKTDGDYILLHATRDEAKQLIATVLKEMLTWLGVPEIAEAHIPKPADTTEEDNHPNA